LLSGWWRETGSFFSLAEAAEVWRRRAPYPGMVPDRAASMLNLRPLDAPNLGGSMWAKGEPVRRRLRMPMRLRVGERPAGAERGDGFEISVLILGAG